MFHQLEKLNNNLNVLFIDMPGSTAATTQIWFRAGSALEEYSNEGIAHFLEHMFFKGTERHPGAQIAHQVESFGGDINAFTSFDYTCYYINSPVSRLDNSIDILLDMVSNPMFKEEDIIPERGVVFEEYRRSHDNPGQYAFQNLQQAIFTDGYAHPILGREETIKNFSREQLTSFRSKYYNLENSLLVVAGDMKKKDQFIKTILKYKLPSGEVSNFPQFKIKVKPVTEIHKKDARMAQLHFLFQAPKYTDQDAAAEDLALNCFGHGESSRMYKSLILDTGLANSCGTSTMFMNKGGVHFLKVVCTPENIDKILTKLSGLFINTLKEGFEEDDIQKIKNQYISSKTFELETVESFAFSLGHSYAQTGDMASEEEFIKRIKATSSKKVNSCFGEILSRPLQVSIQLPDNADQKKVEASVAKFRKTIEKAPKQLAKKALTNKVIKSEFDSQTQVIKIKKGLSLLYRHNPVNPTFVLHAYLKGGLTEETKKNNGIYHLITTCMTKGHSKIPTAKIKHELEDLSTSLHSFSGKNAYGLTMHGLSQNFSKSVFHFIGTLLKPDFLQKNFGIEVKHAVRQLEQQEKDPIKVCFRHVTHLHFNDHPYAMNNLGTKETLKKITRTAVQSLHRKNIREKEILISYCGDLELDQVMEEFKPLFDSLAPRAEKKVQYKKYKSQKGQFVYTHFDREQTQIFYSIPSGKMGTRDNLALKMLTTYLSGQSSELFVDVRDKKGLCYSAQPVHFTALEAGYWGIYMASGFDKVAAAIEAIKGIINRIAEEGLPKEEFLRIKGMIEGQNLLNVQTNDDYANIYSVSTLQGQGLDYYHQNNEAIRNLSYEEFLSQLNKLLNQKWNTVIVGRENPFNA
ncbi:MAG: hypothetical protein COW00_01365 [Bdellovibrio sp. CG12_big_fil_rev_8_21_14_0_65_39_13]|nr:MAG: hypothetical protein COW78_17495 [Bdellovibrio sp. CG22_combo_CG10-13_8_21_14_all_39_27]PIQ62615.1 MAG: hypothetical protein COW00_01365 [Bdellovibrio sp. CG12_big_fil_rev_8_21_14_0_65_39_13]PIR36970.1 MAG: hypothetical protein COV37_00320 [Bdellovibrio sp. CG11_big_fil_rev_8_21_14_0_20_39_38]